MKTSIKEIPFDEKGNLLHYVANWERNKAIWKPNVPWDGTLTLDRISRGRSAAYFLWLDDEGHIFPMFLTDLGEIVRHHTISHGRITGRWGVVKRGTNYGVKLLSPGESIEYVEF